MSGRLSFQPELRLAYEWMLRSASLIITGGRGVSAGAKIPIVPVENSPTS